MAEENEKASDLSKLAFVVIICFLGGGSVVGILMFDQVLAEPVVGGLDGEELTLCRLSEADVNLVVASSNPCGMGVVPHYYPIAEMDDGRVIYDIGCIEGVK